MEENERENEREREKRRFSEMMGFTDNIGDSAGEMAVCFLTKISTVVADEARQDMLTLGFLGQFYGAMFNATLGRQPQETWVPLSKAQPSCSGIYQVRDSDGHEITAEWDGYQGCFKISGLSKPVPWNGTAVEWKLPL